jgi:hypothetical protein
MARRTEGAPIHARDITSVTRCAPHVSMTLFLDASNS